MDSSAGNPKVQNQKFLTNLWNKALDIVFPPICPGCGAFGAAPCTSCLSKIEPFPSECGYCRKITRDFQTHQHCAEHTAFTRLIVAVKYSDVSSKIVEEIKYRYVTSLADFVATQMYSALRYKLTNLPLQPVFVPVPLHVKRERERGFNQAELLAQSLVRAHSIENPKLPKVKMINLLVRTRYTPPQAKLSRSKRLKNLSTAFAINISAVLPPPRSVFILVDDVVTTGATLSACARILKKEFPFHPVWGLAYARRAAH